MRAAVQIAELGIYPAVDPLDSTSRMLDESIVGKEHYDTARAVQKLLQDYKQLQGMSNRSPRLPCPLALPCLLD